MLRRESGRVNDCIQALVVYIQFGSGIISKRGEVQPQSKVFLCLVNSEILGFRMNKNTSLRPRILEVTLLFSLYCTINLNSSPSGRKGNRSFNCVLLHFSFTAIHLYIPAVPKLQNLYC